MTVCMCWISGIPLFAGSTHTPVAAREFRRTLAAMIPVWMGPVSEAES